MPRFSANLGFLWPDLPLVGRIAAAARAGFRAVELHSPYDEVTAEGVRAACAAARVELLGINTPIRNAAGPHVGLAAVPGRAEEFRASFAAALAYCGAAGGRAIHVMAGRVPPEDHAAGRQTLIANLRHAAAAAAPFGIMLLLEPLNPDDMPGYFYSRIEEAIEIIEALAAPEVRLMFDAYHVGRCQGDVIGRLERAAPHIGHIQIAAVPSRGEPDEGALDYRPVIEAIDAIGYAGWIGCEYRPRGSTDAGLGWVAKLGCSLGS